MKKNEEMSGVELREAVAREVVGWRQDDGDWLLDNPHSGTNGGIEMPCYESDISAAFAVVEKMREKGYWCEMRNQFTVVETPDCWAGFTRLGTTGWNGVPDNWTQAATIPFAICRAALKAVRAQ